MRQRKPIAFEPRHQGKTADDRRHGDEGVHDQEGDADHLERALIAPSFFSLRFSQSAPSPLTPWSSVRSGASQAGRPARSVFLAARTRSAGQHLPFPYATLLTTVEPLRRRDGGSSR